jgi:hypothetical protein
LARNPSFASWFTNRDALITDTRAIEERNVNPTDTETYVDRDRNLEIRYCHRDSKTKSFAVVTADGQSFELDSGGNAKAAELVRKPAKSQDMKSP